MRGKLIVIAILVGTVLVLGFAIWFFGNKSPVDQRFKLNRDAVPAGLSAATISNADLPKTDDFLPDGIAGYTRKSINPIVAELDDPNATLHGDAVYADDPDGLSLKISVDKLKPDVTPAQALASVANPPNTKITLHTDAPFPYIYMQTSAANDPSTVTGEGFRWINGGWLFSISSDNMDPETLLEFVNNYPY